MFSPLLGADHMMDALKGIGFFEESDSGRRPVSWREMRSYAKATKDIREPWEFRALFGMSRAYCEGLQLGENVWAKFPWHEDDD